MPPHLHSLSRRERQIMDVLFARGEATVSQVRSRIPAPPSYSAVRSILRILEEKGFIKHREDGRRYVFLPVESADQARRTALNGVLETFFSGSLANAVASLVDQSDRRLTAAEFERIESIIKKARRKQP